MPTVSVIIPAFNCEQFIGETIRSALDQTLSDIEIILVDDGSSDDTRGALKPYASEVRYIYQENAGVGAARNKAMSVASGKYLAFLDHDDIWLPAKLQRQVEVLEEHPELGLLFSDCHIVDSAGITFDRYFRRFEPPTGMVFHQLFLNNFIPLPTVVVPRSVLDQVGGFRHNWSIAQDYDLWLRIARRYPVDYVPEPLAKYRFHSGGSSRRVDRFLQENLELANEYFERYPELGAIRDRKLGRLHYDTAFAYVSQSHLREARRQFLKVLKTRSCAPRAIIYFLLSFLGVRSFDIISAVRKARSLTS